MKWAILLLGIFANASASILIKSAVTPPRFLPDWRVPWSLWQNVPLLSGLILYGAAFIFYALALMRLPLHVAHPVLTSGAIALVALSSVVIFKETLPWLTIVGIFLVLLGIVFITAHSA